MSGPTETLPPAFYGFGEYQLDAGKRMLWRNGTQIPLTPRVFDTLLYLVIHQGELLEKERLMDAVWPDAIVEENNLTQNISTLRRVFGETPGSHRYIVTVPGRGYRFVAEVTAAAGSDAPIMLESRTIAPPSQNGTHANSLAETAVQSHEKPPPKSTARWWALAAALALLGITFLFWRGRSAPVPVLQTENARPNALVPDRSIAVLPFANLSDEKENAFFCEGVQDDILTALAKITDLKVISRTSVANYVTGPTRNLRQIGQDLGVANILEGSVRRAGGKVRVTAQLIETQANRHLWAETYDRDLVDVFAIQSEIAQQIAIALEAKLAPEEKNRLNARPTTNPEAYILYLTALGMGNSAEAEKPYMQAIALDPGFALAYARASILNSGHASSDPERRARARSQALEALRLAPALGEGHMALALNLFWGENKYDAALKEFEVAAVTLPNNAEIPTYVGGIYRRQGRWREAAACFARAQSLDPRNRVAAFLAANHQVFMRQWDTAAADYQRAIDLGGDVFPFVGLAYIEVARNADTGAAKTILAKLPAAAARDHYVMLAQWDLAMLARDYDAAEKILVDLPPDENPAGGDEPKASFQGRTALARGDTDSAQRYLAAATAEFEKHLASDPDSAQRRGQLGLIYAYRQMKEEAIREGRRAVELEPESQNAYHGATALANLALIDALVGETEEALTLIERLLTIPGPVQGLNYPKNITLGDLRLRWEWDSLRNNPRFQKIVSGPEPKTVY